jgi:hypothetical protein
MRKLTVMKTPSTAMNWGRILAVSSKETTLYTMLILAHVNKSNKNILKKTKKQAFKGTVSRRYSTLGFFHQSSLPRSLIIILKYFRIWFRFRRDIAN